MSAPRRALVRTQADVERVRRLARSLAREHGFGAADLEAIVLATSELATNLVRYAPGGAITLSSLEEANKRGVQIESRDRGPGIANLDQALAGGLSTGGGTGHGLSAARRLLDTFEVTTGPEGTVIVATKWLRRNS